MANKEKIDYLLLDIRELETLVAAMRDAEIYPVSFFSKAFSLTHKILNEVHSLETIQVEQLQKQMEEHQALIQSIPRSIATPMPEPVKQMVAQPKPEVPPSPSEVLFDATEPEVMIEETEFKEVPSFQAETSHKTIVTEKSGMFLSDILEKKSLSDFRKAFSLNDRFRFRRELFGGDESKMNKALTDLNNVQTLEDSVKYLINVLNWNVEDEAVADFIKLLEKRFL